MGKQNSNLALIPARAGSKRIPNKNIRLLGEKPLIVYTIECAQEAGVDRIIVSTDSPKIAEISIKAGAEVPFLRPLELSRDDVFDFPVVEHCLNFLFDKENWEPELLIFLRPTMPFRQPEEICDCINLLESRIDADCVRTTAPVCYPPYWMKRFDEQGWLHPFCEEVERWQYTRSQELPETVFCDGYVDVTRVPIILKYKQVVAGRILGKHNPRYTFVDLDEERDWKYAEYLLQQSKEKKGINGN